MFECHSCRQQSLSPDDDALTLDKCEEMFNTLQEDYYEEFKVGFAERQRFLCLVLLFLLCARAFLFSRILPSRLDIKSFLVCVLLQMYDLASLAEPLVFSLVSRAIVAD